MTLSVLKDVATLIPVDAVTSGRALFSEIGRSNFFKNVRNDEG